MNPSTIATLVKLSRFASALTFAAGAGAVIYTAADAHRVKKRSNALIKKMQDDLDNDPGLKLINDLFPN